MVARGRRASKLPVVLALTVSAACAPAAATPTRGRRSTRRWRSPGLSSSASSRSRIARAEAAWLSGDDERVMAETDRIAALARRAARAG